MTDLRDSDVTRHKRHQVGWKQFCGDLCVACCTCARNRYPDSYTPFAPTWCSKHEFDTYRNAVCNEHEEKK